jgi:drug/metabolite transporter (DMT)-like permease
VIFGLGTALAWGIADVAAAVVGRRIGSLATTVASQVAALFPLLALRVATGAPWSTDGGQLAALLATGVVGASAYALFYRALELGPVALVSPVSAAYAAVTVPLAVVFLGESLRGLALVGALLTMAGVVLISADLRRIPAEATRGFPGLAPALGCLVLFGVSAFLLGMLSKDLGWLPTVTLVRVGSVASLLLLLAARRPALRGLGRPAWAAAAAGVGLADIAGVILFAWGMEVGLVSVVSVVSSTYTLIPVAAGVAFLGERPAPNQAAGVLVVIAGLVLLGLAG